MQKLLLTVDKISTLIGQFFSWLILFLTLMISWEVFSRYVLDSPHPWAFDVMSMMYGTLFMMAGAYTLSKNGHVRGDVLYGFFPPRLQAGLVFHSGRGRAGLGGLQLCGGVVGDQ
jgi:TRAP-type mannitol/chloroaromatic compound transport system permease small subunit